MKALNAFRSIAQKLYLTLNWIIALVGLGFYIFNIVAALHDVPLSGKARECFNSTVQQSIGSDTKVYWTTLAARTLKSLPAEARRNGAYLLNSRCGQYLSVTVYDYTGDVGIYLKNYLDGTPASSFERIGYMFWSFAIPAILIAALYGIRRWLIWVLRDAMEGVSSNV